MNRPARLAPQFPSDDLVIGALPGMPSRGGISRFVPLLGLGAIVVIGGLVWGSGMMSRGPTAAVLPMMMLVSAIGIATQAPARGSGASIDHQRTRYLAGLERMSEQLTDAARRQRASLLWTHPAPTWLWTLVGGQRMWERTPVDSDFGHVRIGVGRQRLARRIVVPPVGPVDELDPVTADALRRFVHSHTTLDDAPIAVAVRGVGVLVVSGDPAAARALVRAMVCQLAVLHGPHTVAIVAVVGPGRREHWDWLKWLPHNLCPRQGGPMVYESGAAVEPLGRHAVVIVDGAESRHIAGAGVTVIAIGEEPDATALRLRVDGDSLAVGVGDHVEEFGTADGMTMAQARICARRLAPHRRNNVVQDDLQRWLAALEANRSASLRIALGTSINGELVDLDIKEAAEGGHGPHGLCIGATGSGKSELLRTIVAGMVARHSPDDLNLVLIDFKGGATFLGLDGLPHVAAVITNLADEAHLVTRAKDALGGEIHRRQTLLRHAGNVVNRASYQRIRAHDPTMPGLPALFIVVDEFAELLSHQPDFAELFTMIGRVGRSLGVHLLLSSQRMDEGRLRGLESHLSYRICLKTSTAAESRAVLGVADAAELPAAPGAAFLRTGDGTIVRFQAAYLGVQAPRRTTLTPSNHIVQQFTSIPALATPRDAEATGPTVLDVIVGRFPDTGSPARRVWLPPLTRSPHLSELDTVAVGELTAVIGVVDLPFEQRRAPLTVDLRGAGGNVAVVGAPRSGKSTALCTVISALSMTCDPRQIQFYCLDFGGGTLEALRYLAHVGSVARRGDKDMVRRIVSHVGAILSGRESGRDADEYGDVVLVVDGWSTLREEFPDLEATVTAHAVRGLSFGVHVVLATGRWADIRPGLKDQIGTRLELRLGDPIDSDVDRKQAAVIPIDKPGRGITRDGHHFLIATSGGLDVVRSGSWQAPPVRLLPDVIEHATVVDQAGDDRDRILIGLGDDRLEPVGVDFSRQQHLLLFGDRQCGKTAALRVLCGEIARGVATRPAALFIVDYRRDLLSLAGSPQVLGYAFSASSLADRMSGLITLLQSRLPAADTSIEQLQARSWWTGPEIFVVVDDYDVVSVTSPDALNALLTLLPHAADIGLHVILARRCAGSARAMFEPLIAHLRDSGCAGLLMSGSSEEGSLIGAHRATVQPPGRGLLLTGTAAQLVQIGWYPP